MTGLQYLNFIANIYRVDPAVRRERIARYAERLEIAANLEDLISTYSHGMKQKTAVIAALLHEPRLLVLDEPFVGLDPEGIPHA